MCNEARFHLRRNKALLFWEPVPGKGDVLGGKTTGTKIDCLAPAMNAAAIRGSRKTRTADSRHEFHMYLWFDRLMKYLFHLQSWTTLIWLFMLQYLDQLLFIQS